MEINFIIDDVIIIRFLSCGNIAGNRRMVSWCASKKLAENCCFICVRLMVERGLYMSNSVLLKILYR